MGMHTTKVAAGEGKFALEAQLTVTPRGMAVYACSPEFAYLGATARRINEELGITRDPADLKHLGHVVYRENHGDGRCECECCEVFAAHVELGELHINQEEISGVRRVAPSELDGYLQGHPEQLVPWLREALSDPSIRTALAM